MEINHLITSLHQQLSELKRKFIDNDQVDGNNFNFRNTFNINKFIGTAKTILDKIITVIQTISEHKLIARITNSFFEITDSVTAIIRIVSKLANEK